MGIKEAGTEVAMVVVGKLLIDDNKFSCLVMRPLLLISPSDIFMQTQLSVAKFVSAVNRAKKKRVGGLRGSRMCLPVWHKYKSALLCYL